MKKKSLVIEFENNDLKSKLEDANKEIASLNKIIQSSQEDQATKKLKGVEEQILKLLFETNQELYASDISQKFNIKIGIAEYHINNLLNLGYIGSLFNMEDDTCYYIEPSGRSYIIENKLT